MWTCKKCAASVPAEFDVCWNCCAPREGEGADDCSSSPADARNKCSKCQSIRMMTISDADLSFGHYGMGVSPLKLAVEKSTFFSHKVMLSMHVCADCGHVEQRMDDREMREKLWRLFGEREEDDE